MNWRKYEQYCASWWENNHPNERATVKKKGPHGEDGGIDLLIKDKKGLKFGQCKHFFRENKLKVRYIRELKGVMAREKIERGVFFSSIPFSQHSWKEAKKDGIYLKYLPA